MGILKKIGFLLTSFFVIIFASSAHAALSQDIGQIAELYVNETGQIAIKLSGGFLNAIATNQCPANNGYAGNTTANNAFKAALLTAKAMGNNVRVSILSCDGTWFRIVDVYILQ